MRAHAGCALQREPQVDFTLSAANEEGRTAAMTHQDDRSRIARGIAPDPQRAELRRALLAARLAMSDDRRRAANATLLERLEAVVGEVCAQVVALYWPVRAEPVLGPLPERWMRAGARLVLPVVVGEARPLRFVAWSPGEPTVAGAFGIPRPAGDTPLRPQVLLVPCLGFDARGFRLGYGGGFYDRSLEALDADGQGRPRAIGVAWDEALLPVFAPLPTDRRLDAVVTPSRSLLL